MKNKWLILIVLGFFLVLVLISLFLNTKESSNMNDLKKHSVDLVKCYSSCPIVSERSLVNPEEIIDHINYSCKKQCDTESKPITNGDIMDMHLSTKESNELLQMLKEYHMCIQETVETEIHSCFSSFIEKYS